MAELSADAEDRLLASMLQTAPLADGGFSARVVARVRRRLWVRRLALPTAFVVGLALAAKPAIIVVGLLSRFLLAVSGSTTENLLALLPQLQVVALGGLGFVLVLMLLRFAEE